MTEDEHAPWEALGMTREEWRRRTAEFFRAAAERMGEPDVVELLSPDERALARRRAVLEELLERLDEKLMEDGGGTTDEP